MNQYLHDLLVSQPADISDPIIHSITFPDAPSLPSASTSDGEHIVYRVDNGKPKFPKSPPRHRHDGMSPLPMGMDWCLPPRKWDGRDTVWPHDPRTGWSYTTTVPSWIVLSNSAGSDLVVFYRLQVGIQSPEGITSIRSILRKHKDFVYLITELKRAFPGKYFPPVPTKKFLRMNSSMKILEEQRCLLEDWMETLLSDIEISRSVIIATFIELEAAVRLFFDEENQQNIESSSSPSEMEPSLFAYPVPSDIEFRQTQESSVDLDMKSTSGQENILDPSETVTKFNPFTKKNIMRRIEQLFPRKQDNSTKFDIMEGFGEDFPPESSLWDEKLYLPDSEYQRLFHHTRNLSSESVSTNISLASMAGVSSAETLELQEGDNIQNIPATSVTQNIVLLLDERRKLNRILTTMQQRLGIAKTDMEDLITRLNQEIATRKFLTTKVKNLEVDLETTTVNYRDNMEQAVLTEKEKHTQMQWDIEDLRQQCLELELKLKSEQEERERTEASKTSIINENKLLLQQLDINRYELRKLHSEHEELELKSKADVRVLVKEVKSLRTYQTELKQEIGRLLKENLEAERILQKEQRRTEHIHSANEKLLHECVILRKRLEECSVNIVFEEEDRLAMEASSPSDAIDLLATSDNRIGLLLAEAQLLAEDVENLVLNMEASHGRSEREEGGGRLRKMVTEMFVDNARLRMQINGVLRCSMSGFVKSDYEDEETLLSKNVGIKFMDN